MMATWNMMIITELFWYKWGTGLAKKKILTFRIVFKNFLLFSQIPHIYKYIYIYVKYLVLFNNKEYVI